MYIELRRRALQSMDSRNLKFKKFCDYFFLGSETKKAREKNLWFAKERRITKIQNISAWYE